jgi:hypothetical protein
MELIGLFFIAAGLLVLAGIAKALRPEDTARALLELVPGRLTRHVSLRTPRLVVRVGAIAEAALGACALLWPRPVTATLVAGSYALFAAVVLYARVHGGALSTCGCFGRPDTPATSIHVAINALLTAAAVTVALRASSSATTLGALSHQPWAGVPLLFVSAVGLYLTYLALSPLATLEGTLRLVRPDTAGAGAGAAGP